MYTNGRFFGKIRSVIRSGECFMDRLIRGFAFDGQVRLVAISSANLVQKALDIHGLSPVATAALGRLLTGGAIMGAMLKNDDDKLTLILKGDGPLGNAVVCANKNAVVKGYVQNPIVDLPLTENGKLDVGNAVGKNGLLTVVKDIGLKQPEAGSIEITTKSASLSTSSIFSYTTYSNLDMVLAQLLILSPILRFLSAASISMS